MKPASSSGKVKNRQAIPDGAGRPRRLHSKSFPIVGIGASAGGLEAFTKLVGHLPRKTGMAFVLVQHLAPRHESALRELLSRATQIPVTEVKDGMAVEEDFVYVIPPNVNMGILDGCLHLMPRSPEQQHLPTDFFLRSLAEEHGGKAIGVILSGTASDSTIGTKAIKAEGGITFAKDAKSAKYGDMPRNAIATGCVDSVLPPESIAKELIRIAKHPYLRQAHVLEKAEDLPGEGENGLMKIFVLLRAASGADFTHYKHSTIKRRIKRRMMLHKVRTPEAHINLLQESRAELDALYQDILIHVTGFFRDPEVFEALKKQVFPNMLKSRLQGTRYESGCQAVRPVKKSIPLPSASWSSSQILPVRWISRSSLQMSVSWRWKGHERASTCKASRQKFRPNVFGNSLSRPRRVTKSARQYVTSAFSRDKISTGTLLFPGWT